MNLKRVLSHIKNCDPDPHGVPLTPTQLRALGRKLVKSEEFSKLMPMQMARDLAAGAEAKSITEGGDKQSSPAPSSPGAGVALKLGGQARTCDMKRPELNGLVVKLLKKQLGNKWLVSR